jgi:DNA-binding MarR family transcriptional regulator
MDALELIMLGRQLTRIGERALRGGQDRQNELGAPARSTAHDLPPGSLLVMRDVFAHPGSSITDITTRTGLPQSYVSDSVTRLRERGMAEVTSDRADGRRTLVSISAQHLREVAAHSVGDANAVLLTELGDIDGDLASQIIDVLGELALRLRPAASGKIVSQIRGGQHGAQKEEA